MLLEVGCLRRKNTNQQLRHPRQRLLHRKLVSSAVLACVGLVLAVFYLASVSTPLCMGPAGSCVRDITMATMATAAQETSQVQEVIDHLEELNVNLLALDFDQTIIDIHTGGRWQGTLSELIPHVRPIFQELIPAALASDIQVAIVTFSPQIKIVRGVLDHIAGMEAAQKIPIRGGDRSWQYKGLGSTEGKQAHIASAVEELETNNEEIRITRKSSLLIDDDPKNIRTALADGSRAVWFNPHRPERLLKDILRLP